MKKNAKKKSKKKARREVKRLHEVSTRVDSFNLLSESENKNTHK
jgi:hypothetical protein